MKIYAYITKIQALDKVLPLLCEIKAHVQSSEVLLIINLENKAKAVYLEEFKRVSDACGFDYWDIDQDATKSIKTKLCLAIHNIGKRKLSQSKGHIILSAVSIILRPIWFHTIRSCLEKSLVRNYHKNTKCVSIIGFVLPGYDRKTDPFGSALGDFFKKTNANVFGYFKSITDRGKGVSAIYDESYTNDIVSKIVGKKLDKTSNSTFNCMIYYTEEHRKAVQQNGFFLTKDSVVTGMPSQQPNWIRTLKELYANKIDLFDIVIFTRGRTGSLTGGYFTNDHDAVALVSKVHALMSENSHALDWRITVKPHPYQDTLYLTENLINLNNIRISNDPPFKLASNASLAIGMFTNAIIDALACGVVSVDRVYENESFFKHHPSGSPFSALGAKKCISDKEVLGFISEQLKRIPCDKVVLEEKAENPRSEWVCDFLKISDYNEVQRVSK